MYCSMLEAPAPIPRIAPNHPIPQPAGSTETAASPWPQPAQAGPSQLPAVRTVALGAATPAEAHPEPPPIPASKSNRYLAAEIQRKRVDGARVEWVVPPLVARTCKRSNGRFELAEYNDETAWIYRSANAKVNSSSTWYDRELGRRLHFGRYTADEGVLDDDVFGAPVPQFPFFTMDGQTARPQRASNWMYRSRSPKRGEEGRRAQTPPPTRLPWAPGCSPSEEEGGGQCGKGKGKNMEFDDSDNSDEGMDLADVVAGPVATNVIVVEGLDDALSAVAFEAIARDTLYRSGARPLTIVHARGQMWVRMEDAAGGQRALRGLGSLWPELRLGY
ncbi:hypothetical protein DFH08DRAFT_954952 [Mycena albidolilacea]|uniref:Uncharacterized protein n=1 Tax=Mycena albidolilacea TaxID=1033008 RepID=A0AAD7ACW6_9AGAR|nr:hypothetical protein DFH08DRAFT_954952 [Mycena albidolilacea]